MRTKTIMVQGTASHVGKSVVVTALCRILKRQGFSVAPFKAQNMANNSCPTPDGGEIGRAQSVQAEACGIVPSVYMNPILLKPTNDTGSQVVVMGKPVGIMTAKSYQKYKEKLFSVVKDALFSLLGSYDFLVIEGAGSPVEINIKKYDLTNMYVARLVTSPVILVGDIDRGGVFAQFLGTLQLLPRKERRLVKAFLVNKFRGDERILAPGLRWLEEKTRRRVLGVLPFVKDMDIPEEDSVAIEDPLKQDAATARPSSRKDYALVHVVRLPRISNFTDFDALKNEKDVVLQYVQKPDRHIRPDFLVIPGTKSTIADLQFLRASGLADYIRHCVREGVPVLGICGGYQMLGERILDPEHVESGQNECKGLGLLPVITVFQKEKETAQVRAVHPESLLEIEGYEIHMGCTQEQGKGAPFLNIVERYGMKIQDQDGLVLDNRHSPDIKSFVAGTYIHGIFDNAGFRRFFMNKVRQHAGLAPLNGSAEETPVLASSVYDTWADLVEKNMDMEAFTQILTSQK